MKGKEVLFSVVVTIYNASATLRTCIDSIIKQKKFTNYEIVLIDDGSTDNSYDISKEYEKQFPKFIKAYTFKNRGVAMSRLAGVEHSKGKYIIFVDSDDSINSLLLKNVANIIFQYQEIDIVRYQVNLFNDEEYKNHERHNCMKNVNNVMNGITALKLWSGNGMKYALYWLYAFRRTLFSNNTFKMPNLRCFEDVAYIPLLIANSKRVITIRYRGYNYKCNSTCSLTNNENYDKLRKRSIDFYNACVFAVEDFNKFDFITEKDKEFFLNDYQKRINGYFYGLPKQLRIELSGLYKLPVREKN